jgi:hypothetical protein
MRITFYIVDVDGAVAIEGAVATSTLAHARRVRAECTAPDGRILRVTTQDLRARDLAVALFNRVGFGDGGDVEMLPPSPRRLPGLE